MSREPDEPNWQLLPRDPQRFFELPDNFDRKQLKRSYNRWLRKFKPESHPAEFQRIRAAYEELDRALRYGGEVTPNLHAPITDSAWPTGTPEPSPKSSGLDRDRRDRATPLPPELHARVLTQPPADLYSELQDKAEKSPYDYYALATLADVCDKKDKMQFVRWLLEGLRRNPKDHALRRLVQAYLSGPTPPNTLPKILLAAAKAVGTDAFYHVTEPGWEKLLAEEPVDVFISTLRACEPHLKDESVSGKVAFLIRTLRAVQWKADASSPEAVAWVRDAIDFIDANFEYIPPTSEFEVDLLSFVREYLEVRSSFVSRGSLVLQIDKALENYFTKDQVLGDYAVIEQQLQMASDVSSLLAIFPPNKNDPSLQAFYSLWAWVSEEVAERNENPAAGDADASLWPKRAHALLKQIEAKSDASTLGILWNWSGMLFRVVQVMVFVFFGIVVAVPVAGVFSAVTDSIVIPLTLAVVSGAVSCYFGGRWGSNLVTKKIWHPFCRWIAGRCYRTLWRRDAMDMLNRSRLTFHQLCDLVSEQANHQISTSAWFSKYLSEDYAMAMYALALRHVA